MPLRRKGRTLALQLLYQIEIGKGTLEDIDELVEAWPFGPPPDRPARAMAVELVRGVLERKDDLDARIAAVAQHWSLSRMLAVDRNLLRLATYELRATDTPAPIVINEAIELAKLFGDDHSPRFVNGILDALAKTKDT